MYHIIVVRMVDLLFLVFIQEFKYDVLLWYNVNCDYKKSYILVQYIVTGIYN